MTSPEPMKRSRWRQVRLLVVVCAALCVLATSAQAKTAVPDPLTSGREALQKSQTYPWYNSETDSVRRIELKIEAPRENSGSNVNVDFSWLQYLAWGLIGVVLIGLVALLIWSLLNRETRDLVTNNAVPDEVTDADRIEALPFMARRSQGDLLAQARRHYQEGNYREAIIYLFSYQLVELDKHGLVRLAKGKTNRQYLRETSPPSPLGRLLEQSMVAFEGVFFGDHDLDRPGFESCWNQLEQFERLLAQVPS
jgi:hypothetical protein